MALPRALARLNRRGANKVTALVAGRLPGFAIVSHTGRKSGRGYRTPVNAFRDGDAFTIALTYGTDSDWLKNVLAAGGCELEYRGAAYELDNPTVAHDSDASWAPLPVRVVLRTIDAPHYVRLHVAR